MKSTVFSVPAAVAGAFALSISAAAEEKPIAWTEIPDVARESLRHNMAGAATAEHAVSLEGEQTLYAAETTRSGLRWVLTVNASGEIESNSQEMSVNQLPDLITSVIDEHFAGSTVESLLRTVRRGVLVYDIDILQAGQRRTLSIDREGNVVRNELRPNSASSEATAAGAPASSEAHTAAISSASPESVTPASTSPEAG